MKKIVFITTILSILGLSTGCNREENIRPQEETTREQMEEESPYQRPSDERMEDDVPEAVPGEQDHLDSNPNLNEGIDYN